MLISVLGEEKNEKEKDENKMNLMRSRQRVVFEKNKSYANWIE